jgi:hypothetical protein
MYLTLIFQICTCSGLSFFTSSHDSTLFKPFTLISPFPVTRLFVLVTHSFLLSSPWVDGPLEFVDCNWLEWKGMQAGNLKEKKHSISRIDSIWRKGWEGSKLSTENTFSSTEWMLLLIMVNRLNEERSYLEPRVISKSKWVLHWM